MKVTSQSTNPTSKPRLFWKFGAEFHGTEGSRHDATDFIVFSLMGLLCVWPIVTAAVAIVHVFVG